MITRTVRPLWPRIKARIVAWHYRRVIHSYEREEMATRELLDRLPRDLDKISGSLSQLRVRLILTEQEF